MDFKFSSDKVHYLKLENYWDKEKLHPEKINAKSGAFR